MNTYDHLVCVDEDAQELVVFRVGADGKRTLFTRVALPQVEGWSAELQDLAKALGENLLIDSPVIRRILNVRDMKQGAPQLSRKVRGIA
ncbi:MAG: hypothetical protein WCC51_16800 [Stenotrophomonas indicatrix]|uniref:hypothetical protein n=1 Tax=Stenotrophomonas indicatrix TaxID=2045451 RepID=UPI001F34563D